MTEEKDLYINHDNPVHIKTPEDNTTFNLFFELFKYLKSTQELNVNVVPDLDYKLKQTALSEKELVGKFFESVVDQARFYSEDHKRLRQFLIDWYTSQRTIITQNDNLKDPFKLSGDELDELIKSFAFPYPKKLTSLNKKANFILELVSLYKKKGTPEVLVKTLQTYFGLNSVVLTEWWIHKKPYANSFFAKSVPIYPRFERSNPDYIVELDLENFEMDDPLWQITEDEIRIAYATSKITLPSITPYISISGAYNISELEVTSAILNRRMQESFEYWQQYGTLYRSLSSSRLSGLFSILELFLAMVYLFNGQTDTNDTRFLYYKGIQTPFDKEDSRDDIVNIDYALIIDEYNTIKEVRPQTRSERDNLLEIFYEKFTAKIYTGEFGDINDSTAYFDSTSSDFPDFTGIEFPYPPGDGDENGEKTLTALIRNPGRALEMINPTMKAELDLLIYSTTGVVAEDYAHDSYEYIQLTRENEGYKSLLEDIFLDIQYHLTDSMEILQIPIVYTTLGKPFFSELREVVDFFKPYRVRIREYIITFQIKDPLAHSAVIEDHLITSPNEIIAEKGPWRGNPFTLEEGLVTDLFYFGIGYTFREEIVGDDLLHDYCITTPNEIIKEPRYEVVDRLIEYTINEIIVEKGPFELDQALVRDFFKISYGVPAFQEDVVVITDSFIAGESFSHRMQTRYDAIHDINVPASNEIIKEYGSFGYDHGLTKDSIEIQVFRVISLDPKQLEIIETITI